MARTKGLVNRQMNSSEKGRGHARTRHSGPATDAGPSIDAYLKQRFGKKPSEGSKMSAFYNDNDQDRAVKFAFGEVKQHSVDGTRTTMKVRTGGTLGAITVRVCEIVKGTPECYDAKLREATVVVDNLGKSNEVIVTAYPSESYRT